MIQAYLEKTHLYEQAAFTCVGTVRKRCHHVYLLIYLLHAPEDTSGDSAPMYGCGHLFFVLVLILFIHEDAYFLILKKALNSL